MPVCSIDLTKPYVIFGAHANRLIRDRWLVDHDINYCACRMTLGVRSPKPDTVRSTLACQRPGRRICSSQIVVSSITVCIPLVRDRPRTAARSGRELNCVGTTSIGH